ncbi:class I SAM-dependent methyltransferase [soil metagenome]
MTRAEGDTWNLASSVGATATLVAVGRALASAEDNALVDDPFAAPLVRAVGVEYFTKLLHSNTGDSGSLADTAVDIADLITDVMAVRTRFFDDFFLDCSAAGIRQAVILASGLDSRAYRLPWPDGTVIYEIDQPEVITFKTTTMESLGANPAARLCAVAVDLRADWPAELHRNGFEASVPTAWSAEGLLMYLPPDSQDRLLDDITTLSAPGSQLATEYTPDDSASILARGADLNHQPNDHDFTVNASTLFYPGKREPVADYLTSHDWDVCGRSRSALFEQYGRAVPVTEAFAPLLSSLAIVATRR